jgi:hypothetical protein
MCDLIGYVGKKQVVPVILDGLRRLEYRGYDSAGIAVAGSGQVEVEFRDGTRERIHFLASRLKYSRFLRVSLVKDETEESLVRTLAEHLASWGGRPLLCVFDRLGHFRAERGHQRVERRLSPSITAFPNSPQNLQRGQIRRFLQNLADLFSESHEGAGPTDLSFPALGHVIDVPHRALFSDAFYRTQPVRVTSKPRGDDVSASTMRRGPRLDRPSASSRVNSMRHSAPFNKPLARLQPTSSLMVVASSLRLRPGQVATTSRIRAISDAGNIRPLHLKSCLPAGLATAGPPMQPYDSQPREKCPALIASSRRVLGSTK